MRCDNCDYCRYSYADDLYECIFGFEGEENSKGQYGCRYNRKTLDKIHKEMWEAEAEECRRMAEYFDSPEFKGEK